MEAFSVLQQVASIVQQIVDAVETVRRNKEECGELAKHVKIVGDLLTQLEGDPDMMQIPATRDALKGMEEILRRTYKLITACQGMSISYRFILGKKQAAKLRAAKDNISSQLLLFSVAGHVHTTCLLRRIQNIPAQPEVEIMEMQKNEDAEQVGLALLFQEDVEEVVSSHSSPQHDARLAASDETKRAPAVADPSRIPEMLASLPWITIFSFSQLKQATNKFSCVIGYGAFATVYKGTLRSGLQVAIKRYSNENDISKDCFDNEVLLGAKLQHINIVKLVGYCNTKREKLLVHEFMSRGCLLDHIFGTADLVLPWRTRFQIVEGIAQGALYLHKYCGLRIVHTDLKPSNIILDDDWTPKIADFGISRMLPRSEDEGLSATVAGTVCYIDPEYKKHRCFSAKTDVYSFGVMLLEIISGKNNNQAGDYNLLIGWVWERWNARKLTECIDPRLAHVIDVSETKEMKRCIHIALLCVQEKPAQRPTMSGILRMLSDKKLKLPIPQQWSEQSSVDVAETSGLSSADVTETGGLSSADVTETGGLSSADVTETSGLSSPLEGNL